jgi:cytochrome c nitrite reductase small subunit
MARRIIMAALILLLGGTAGIGAATFLYADGDAYLRDDPAACANCHIMREQYQAWQRGSHRAAATCNDCHAEHAVAAKLLTKARNGFWHSVRFTLDDFHEPIFINERNRRVTEGQCRHCHATMVAQIGQEGMECIRCHSDVGHMH